MLENLEETLEALGEQDLSRYALANAESLWITFRDVYEKEFDGDAALINKHLDSAWALVDAEDRTEAAEMEEEVKSQIPDLDDYDEVYATEWRSAHASAAQNAVISVWQAIASLHSGEGVQNAIETASITESTIDLLINTRQSIVEGDSFDYDDEFVENHQMMQDELARQQESIDALQGDDNDIRKFVRPLSLDALGSITPE